MRSLGCNLMLNNILLLLKMLFISKIFVKFILRLHWKLVILRRLVYLNDRITLLLRVRLKIVIILIGAISLCILFLIFLFCIFLLRRVFIGLVLFTVSYLFVH